MSEIKRTILFFLIILAGTNLFGQSNKMILSGAVSYVTHQNIYAKFDMPGMVHPGDTILIRKNQVLTPLFIAESVSSTSCVGKPLQQFEVKVADTVFVRVTKPIKSEKSTRPTEVPSLKTNGTDSLQVATQPENIVRREMAKKNEQRIRGRLSASSFSSFSKNSEFNQRMRYSFAFTANHISGSKFSTDTYIMFTHRLNHWADVQNNIFSALKIYSLAVNYDATDKTHFVLGRKINPHLASVGAIDGLQGEKTFGNFTLGLVAGTNPDYTDYSFNPKLFEFGGYLAYSYKNKNGFLNNSLGFFNQTNSGKTDRRFVYFQHDNTLFKNVNLFASIEMDLYALKNGLPTNSLSLTSLYLSLQYRFSQKFSLWGSYDARKNVIYYETFKNFLDQMLQDATRQGYQFRINYRPTSLISSYISGGYRFQKKDIHPMLNANGYLTFNKVPGANSSLSLSANWLQNSYTNGMIYGIRIYSDLIPSKLSTDISYRLVNYKYLNNNSSLLQHMPELELSWMATRKFSVTADYQGTFDKTNNYHSIYISLIRRF